MKGYEKITNPVTGRKVSVYGKTGQTIIHSYINNAQSGGDATPHMGARPARRSQGITQAIRDAGRIQLADGQGSGTSVQNGPAAAHGHAGVDINQPNSVSAIEISMVAPVAQNLRPRARGTRAERDEGIAKGTPLGPYFPVELNSLKMAEVLQSNVVNKTKDQINFLSEEGDVSAGEREALEDAVRLGDGSGFIDFPGLKLLFRGVLYDFLLRDGKIIFQLQKNPNVHSRCQTRGSRRLDGCITYTKSKKGQIVLTKVDLERPSCWPKPLGKSHPVASVSL